MDSGLVINDEVILPSSCPGDYQSVYRQAAQGLRKDQPTALVIRLSEHIIPSECLSQNSDADGNSTAGYKDHYKADYLRRRSRLSGRDDHFFQVRSGFHDSAYPRAATNNNVGRSDRGLDFPEDGFWFA